MCQIDRYAYQMLTLRRKKRLLQIAKQRQSGLIVVLEDIHDPHNAAAILRSCDAFGVQEVYFIFDKEERYNPRRVGKASSSSANKWLDFKIFNSTKDCFRQLKKSGYKILVTALSKSATNLFEKNLTEKKIALVIGNEHRGVSTEALRLADEIIYIPMRGFVQSLNVSVAAAIFLFEITRERKGKSKLPPRAVAQLAKNFMRIAKPKSRSKAK